MGDTALKIVVTGIVQGVGFRPFVYRVATLSSVKGYVRNLGGSEVEIWVEGGREQLAKFLRLFFEMLPPPAKLDEIELYHVKPRGYERFEIKPSASSSLKRSMIPPDFAVCKECLREVLDPRDRRYRYPFNSCAYCGPRFSMMYTIPYDRENTAMRDFPLCNECLKEYKDPWNIRRFHAQGISCPVCGPKVKLYTVDGVEVDCKDPIREAAKLIDEGFLVAVKGLGGFHIAALATDDDVVIKLRRRKGRPQEPFALMALDANVASKLVVMGERERKLFESPEAPILVLPKREDAPVSEYVAPGLDTLGVMRAYTPLHYLLLMDTRDKYLIMTSGNPHGKPMCTTEECVFRRLRNIVDYVLVHNRVIVHRVDDSVIRFTRGKPMFLRRSRGYAPVWVRIGVSLCKEVVAFGAELQNVGGVGFEDKVVLTQYVGDTDDFDTLMDLDRFLRWFVEVYRIDVRKAVLVADMHPGYASRRLAERWASEYGSRLLLVQHHHAHVASVVAEHRLDPFATRVGVAIDGVGYGDDGTIWGGEVLVFNALGYKRLGGLEPQPMPGGDRATIYPARVAIAMLVKAYGFEEGLEVARKVGLFNKLPEGEKEAKIAALQVKTGRAPLASSTGRFLDAVSALLGVCWFRSYEGEPAIKLEAFGRRGKLLDDIEARVVGWRVDTTSLFKQIVEAVLEGVDRRSLAYTAMWRLGEALAEIALKALNKAEDCSRVVVSGGAAVNDVIIAAFEHVLGREGVELLLPRRVPAGDGGIALGQVLVAGLRAEEEGF